MRRKKQANVLMVENDAMRVQNDARKAHEGVSVIKVTLCRRGAYRGSSVCSGGYAVVKI